MTFLWAMPQQQAPPQAGAPTTQQIDPPEPPQGQGVDFEVRAIDAATGQGLPGVAIVLTRIATINRGPIVTSTTVMNATYTFTAGAKAAPVTLRMWKSASMDGVVVDRDGNALANVTVQIVEEGWTGGLRTLSLGESVQTDKPGKFVMSAVLPGTYYLRAIPAPGVVQEQLKASDQTSEKHVAFVDTLCPNAMYFEQAAPLAIVPGVNVFGLRIEMQKSKYYSFSGRVFGIPPERQQVSGLVLMRRVSFDSPFPFIWASPMQARSMSDCRRTAPLPRRTFPGTVLGRLHSGR